MKALLDAIRAKAKELLPEGSRVVLFGSRARNEARPDSDWDIHILIPGDRELLFNEWAPLSIQFDDIGMAYNQFVSTVVYTTFSWNKRKILPFYKNVEKEKVILFKN